MAGKWDRRVNSRRLEAERGLSVSPDFDQGCKPWAVTRDLDWARAFPCSAPTAKATACTSGSTRRSVTSPRQSARQRGDANGWGKSTEVERRAVVHFIGKDNIVFASSAMLHAHGGAGIAENVPLTVSSRTSKDKISGTSRNRCGCTRPAGLRQMGRVIVTRFVTAPETKDNDFHLERFQARNNSELVAIPAIREPHAGADGRITTESSLPRIALSDEDRARLEAIQGSAGATGRSHPSLQIPGSPTLS